MVTNLTLGKEGTSFFGDGVRLSWPTGARRPVVPRPAGEISLRIRQRIAEGYIVETDDAANRPAYRSPASRILDPAEARARREQRQAPGEAVVEPTPAAPEAEQEPTSAEAQSEPTQAAATAVADTPKPVTSRVTRSQPTKRRSRTTRGG